MAWLKHITVDLIATLVIAIVVFYDPGILDYVLFVYTGLMVFARTFSMLSTDFRLITKKKVSEAPVWMYHLLYFLNVVFLIWGSFYITGAAWLYIWIVATWVYFQQEKAKGRK